MICIVAYWLSGSVNTIADIIFQRDVVSPLRQSLQRSLNTPEIIAHHTYGFIFVHISHDYHSYVIGPVPTFVKTVQHVPRSAAYHFHEYR